MTADEQIPDTLRAQVTRLGEKQNIVLGCHLQNLRLC